jgi:ATP-dependent DNA helicase RecG
MALKVHCHPRNALLQADNWSNKIQHDPIKIKHDPLNDPLNKMQVQLLDVLKTKPKTDYAILAKILDVSPATVKRHIQELKSVGRLKRVGSKKTGYWEVIG